jgi:hypothetical protein
LKRDRLRVPTGIRILIVIVAIGGWIIWEFGVKASMAKSQAWEGTLKETLKERRWLSGLKKPSKPDYLYYNYYWVVTCSDGQTRTVQVPSHLTTNARTGDPIRKVLGKRWPELATMEADSDRKIKEQYIGDLIK